MEHFTYRCWPLDMSEQFLKECKMNKQVRKRSEENFCYYILHETISMCFKHSAGWNFTRRNSINLMITQIAFQINKSRSLDHMVSRENIFDKVFTIKLESEESSYLNDYPNCFQDQYHLDSITTSKIWKDAESFQMYNDIHVCWYIPVNSK